MLYFKRSALLISLILNLLGTKLSLQKQHTF